MRRSLAIVGGGLAGIAAAEAAVRRGFKVDLFEWSRVLGGRAASIFDPVSGCWLDNGQHLTLGCCSEFIALNQRLGVSNFFEKKDSIPFAQVGGKRWTISPLSLLPASWQLLPSFLRIPLLTFRQRLSTAFALRKLGRVNYSPNWKENARLGYNSDFLFSKWLKDEKISSQCIENFWEPLILSSLCDAVENVAFDAVQKVVRDGFLAGRKGMTVYIPKKPLRAIYHDEVLEKLKSMGVNVHFLSRVTALRWELLPEQNSSAIKITTDKNSTMTANEISDDSINSSDSNNADNSNNSNNDAEESDYLNNPNDDKEDNNENIDNLPNIYCNKNSDENSDASSADVNNENIENVDGIEEIGEVEKVVSVEGVEVEKVEVENADQNFDLELESESCSGVGVDINFRLKELGGSSPVVTGLEFSGGEVRSFDRYILAVPAFRAREILDASELESFSDGLGLAGFEPGAITSVHLWLNRRLLSCGELHTALVGGVGQFLFCPQVEGSKVGGFYHVVLISASHRILSELELASVGSLGLVGRVMRQLELTFNRGKDSLELFHYRVTTYFDAVFSPHPLVYSCRPFQDTSFINFALAGDWTQTGWPSTLEGAVRSGLLAVDSIDFDSEQTFSW
ncbi:MAG: FAD-dependent oxidoreductase [Planctomycetaceae bacterium]|jgi:hypothetical protein|nr:FAD-dependent oxidoreductase [Planctomycetaceae bacterium]